MVFLFTLEKDETVPSEGKWPPLEGIGLREVSQTQKVNIAFVSHLRILNFLWIVKSFLPICQSRNGLPRGTNAALAGIAVYSGYERKG